MSPNGGALFALIVIIGALAASRVPAFAALCMLVALFALVEVRAQAVAALRRSLLIVLPLAVFMGLVWVGIVGRSPAEIASNAPGSRSAAALYATFICLRLFLIVLAVQLMVLRFSHMTPLQFICALRLPAMAKRLLVLTLSLMETLRHAVDRARTALIAAGTITRRPSFRNLINGWMLVQTVWLSTITVAVGRLRDKWPVENTPGLLDDMLRQRRPVALSGADGLWLPLAFASVAIGLGVG